MALVDVALHAHPGTEGLPGARLAHLGPGVVTLAHLPRELRLCLHRCELLLSADLRGLPRCLPREPRAGLLGHALRDELVGRAATDARRLLVGLLLSGRETLLELLLRQRRTLAALHRAVAVKEPGLGRAALVGHAPVALRLLRRQGVATCDVAAELPLDHAASAVVHGRRGRGLRLGRRLRCLVGLVCGIGRTSGEGSTCDQKRKGHGLSPVRFLGFFHAALASDLQREAVIAVAGDGLVRSHRGLRVGQPELDRLALLPSDPDHEPLAR